MINRKNWKITKTYLEYRQNVDLISTGSIGVEMTYLRHILEWAGEIPFSKGDSIRPSLPEYMLTARLDCEDERLSESLIKKTISTARRLFTWMKVNYPEYRAIKSTWINTLKAKRLEDLPKKNDTVNLEGIIKIAFAPVESLIEERIRAAAVFWFLSGIRIGAFVSLPLKAVDIENRFILQYPNLGVRTKGRKAAKTYLLDIPELLAVVRDWDNKVRAVLPESGFWFAPFSMDTGEIDPSYKSIGNHRQTLARKNLKAWLDKVELPYHSPHKFRHGHIHYGLEHSKTVADFKAVSLNVMHASMDITDEIYSRLDEKDIQIRIEQLTIEKQVSGKVNEDVIALFQEFLEWRKAQK
jgi:site-specific recombinase XerC